MENQKRKSIRLKNYDYSLPCGYYITICTQDRACRFGDVIDGQMVLNDVGEIVNKWWLKIPQRFPNTNLDGYQIMPNHLHGIIVIHDHFPHRRGNSRGRPMTKTGGDKPQTGGDKPRPYRLGDIVGSFKSLTINEYIRGVKNHGWPRFRNRIWQRNYYENIIRSKNDLQKIRRYIQNNPQMWDRDKNNPKNWKKS